MPHSETLKIMKTNLVSRKTYSILNELSSVLPYHNALVYFVY